MCKVNAARALCVRRTEHAQGIAGHDQLYVTFAQTRMSQRSAEPRQIGCALKVFHDSSVGLEACTQCHVLHPRNADEVHDLPNRCSK